MMYTSPSLESEEAARSQVEPLQIQPRLLLGRHCRRWLSFQKLQKQFWREGLRRATNYAHGNGGPIKLVCQ